MLEKQLLDLIQRYLSGQIGAPDFYEEFASFYFAVRQERDAPREAVRICGSVIGPYAEFSRGHRSEDSFRRELANAIRSFAGSKRRMEWGSTSAGANSSVFGDAWDLPQISQQVRAQEVTV